jgi:hypothetical protein
VADFQQQYHVVHIPSIFAFEVHIKQNSFGSKYYGIAICRHNGSNNIFRFDLDKQAATQLQKEHIQKEYFRDPSIQQYNRQQGVQPDGHINAYNSPLKC